MRTNRIGSLLLGLGVVVGAVASLGLVIGFKPARLAPALLSIAAYKLTFLGAFGLLSAGAVLNRWGVSGTRRSPGDVGSERTWRWRVPAFRRAGGAADAA